MKTAFKIFILLAIVGYLVFAFYEFAAKAEDRTCEGVSIEILEHPCPGRLHYRVVYTFHLDAK